MRLKQTINTTPQKAYAAFTEPAHLSRWFTASAQAELKVGGKYSNADGDKGTYLVLEPSHRVKFTWENEKHCPGTIAEVSFNPTAEGEVKVELTHSDLVSEQDWQDMQGGWSWALASLKSYLETGKPIPYEEWLKSQPK